MGIRGKLLLLAAGIAVPLVLVGTLDLRNMWRLSRSQLNDSVKQQVDLASVALERWLDDQKKALDAIAALAGDKDTHTPTIRENLDNVLRTRPFWLDLRITNATGSGNFYALIDTSLATNQPMTVVLDGTINY